MTDAKPNLKARALHEFARFATMFAYLWAMFLLFQIHQYVVLAQHQIPFTQFGVGLVNALVLAKVMLVADDLRLGEFEKMVIGVVHGKAVAQSIETPGDGGILGGILVSIIIAIALVPFFAFVELSRLMDPGELTRIFFTRGPRSAASAQPNRPQGSAQSR